MTCIKTGARVRFTEFENVVLSADLFQVGDAIVIRTNPQALGNRYGKPPSPFAATHAVTFPFGGQNVFQRDDIGVFVVPKNCVEFLK